MPFNVRQCNSPKTFGFLRNRINDDEKQKGSMPFCFPF